MNMKYDKDFGIVADINDVPLSEWQEVEAMNIPTEILAKVLYERGVTIKQLFGKYYELEAMADGRTMSVEDAEYAL